MSRIYLTCKVGQGPSTHANRFLVGLFGCQHQEKVLLHESNSDAGGGRGPASSSPLRSGSLRMSIAIVIANLNVII